MVKMYLYPIYRKMLVYKYSQSNMIEISLQVDLFVLDSEF